METGPMCGLAKNSDRFPRGAIGDGVSNVWRESTYVT